MYWSNIVTEGICLSGSQRALYIICTEKKTTLSVEDIISLIDNKCDGVIGQLTEDWGERLISALSRAGWAVGYNNVDVDAANKYAVAVGNETTAELAASLSLATARRIVEAGEFMRSGLYDGWLPHFFVGNLLKGQTLEQVTLDLPMQE
ncbi:glycerate dehydrogenase-like isoform X2 [Salvia hispanica]|uniref:glycerate dehydrogenase-like isoform X2 n=1 Tax=Salvia hispanica TaxID=49212 RepID=UPI0020096FA8|nr:glycerate dehydrogenase-like isoform X2 [Salvia hispanica]